MEKGDKKRKERCVLQQRKTTAKVAKQASKVMRNAGTSADAKAVAGSALSQRAPKAKPLRKPREK